MTPNPCSNKPCLCRFLMSAVRVVCRYIVNERNILFATWIPLVAGACALSLCDSSLVTNFSLAGYCVLIAIAYCGLLYTVVHFMTITKTEQPNQEIWFVVLYSVVTIVLVLLFAFGWLVFGNFGPSGSNEVLGFTPDRIDSFYFSAVVFSTLGFGDFVPVNKSGKLFLSFEVLLSSVHLIAFFSILMTKRRAS